MSRLTPWFISSLGVAGVSALLLAAGCREKPPAAPVAQSAPAPTLQSERVRLGALALSPPGAEKAYTGNQACKPCHAREFTLHERSTHAHTLTMIPTGQVRPEFRTSNEVVDPLKNCTYSVKAEGGRNLMVARVGPDQMKAGVRIALGSGRHAITYMGRSDTEFIEYRISYYPNVKRWNFTPGRGPKTPPGTIIGETYTDQEVGGCFTCHSTVLVGNSGRLDLEKSLINVGCERCHGPGKEHVDSARAAEAAFRAGQTAQVKKPSVRPETLDGPKVMKLCGDCHRLPGSTADGGVLQEGSPMLESQLARFPGVALSRSACFKGSNGKLSCMTCHNAHEALSKPALSYDRTCQSCHTAPHGKTCAMAKTSNCVSCHMPEQVVGRKLGMHYHNHWIRANIPPEEQLHSLRLAPDDQKRLMAFVQKSPGS